MNLKEEINRASPMVDRVNDAIRDNPLAAGLIGAGLAWMLFGTKGFATLGGLATHAASGTASAAATAAEAASDGVRSAGKAAASMARSAASVVADKAASIVPDIDPPDGSGIANSAADASAAVGERLQSVAATGKEYGSVLKSRLSDGLERQPLLLGAIGLAIGAGIASTFASTKIESEWIGERGAQARDAMQEVLTDVKDRAQEVLSEVQDEASRQGLTVEGAKEAASSVAGKLRNVAGTATDAAKKPFTASTDSRRQNSSSGLSQSQNSMADFGERGRG
jgi:hypothetical protein